VPPSWSWDPTLFEGAAPYYERGRLPYAPGLADALSEALGLDGNGRLLDVGCGPGTVALRLAHLFEEVVGLDPDPGMLQAGQQLAEERKVSNTRWVQLRAEELPGELGRFRVVTFAQSLHWLDQPAVFSSVRSMLIPDGAVVHVDTAAQSDNSSELGTLPFPSPPEARMSELRKTYLGPERRAGQGVRSSSPDGEDAVFRAVGFVGPQRVRVPHGRVLERSVDDLVAEKFSHSSTAPHLFGDRKSDFESELRRLLQEASPTGRFSVGLADNELKIWRPA